MTKINLVIASILKPVNDTRMYEKFGISFAQSKKYSVHIIGYESEFDTDYPDIYFYPLFKFNRLNLTRIFAPIKYYKLLLKIKPQVVIVNTPELLIVTCFYKILFGAKILYDIRENYYYNLLYISKIKAPLKFIASHSLRLIELATAPLINKFILAEKSYEQELPFINKKFAVVENKYYPIFKKPETCLDKEKSIYHLLYTGTIAESFGIYEAINLAIALHKLDPKFHLTIIGYCADRSEFAKVLNLTASLPFIKIIGGSCLVPHKRIIEAIWEADIGLMLYPYNRATYDKIPTKLYEYIYNELPIISYTNPIWDEFYTNYKAAITVESGNINHSLLYCKLIGFRFYINMLCKQPILWNSNFISYKLII